MSEDLFLTLLMKHSVSHLQELRAEATEKERQGTLEGAYIDKALELKRGAARAPAQAKPTQAPPKTSKPVGARGPIKTIVASDPERTWMPADVRDELHRRWGLAVKTNTVRATMKRLLDDQEFARPYEGAHGFKIASSNGSGGKPHEETTTSAPSGSEPHGELPASKDRSE